MRKSIILAATAIVACAGDPSGPAPPIGSISGGTNNDSSGGTAADETGGGTTTNSSGGGSAADETGGGDTASECPDWGRYECRGWVAGLYRYNGAGTNWQFANLPGGINAFDCVDDISIVAPIMDDNSMLLDLCRTECENRVAAGEWDAAFPASVGAWQKGATVCVVEANGNNGRVPSGPYGTPGPGSAACPNVGPIGGGFPTIDQITLVDNTLPNPDCAPGNCATWDPSLQTTHTYNPTTKHHVVTADDLLMLDILEGGGMADLYSCDVGRWRQSMASGSEAWSMSGLAAGDLLYSLGFRSGDKTLKIRRNVTGAPTFTLNSYVAMADAFDALRSYTDFWVTFQRPVKSGSTTILQNHTMRLTIN